MKKSVLAIIIILSLVAIIGLIITLNSNLFNQQSVNQQEQDSDRNKNNQEQTQRCLDSDGGNDKFSPSVSYRVSSKDVMWTLFTAFSDMCLDDGALIEDYCINNERAMSTEECPENYICKKDIPFNNPFIEDLLEEVKRLNDEYHFDENIEKSIEQVRSSHSKADACVPIEGHITSIPQEPTMPSSKGLTRKLS